jgi:hypothetical protein
MGKACRHIRPGKPEAPTLGNNLMPGYIITPSSKDKILNPSITPEPLGLLGY